MSRLFVLTPLLAILGVVVMMPAPTPAAQPAAPAPAAPKAEEELVEKVRKAIDSGVNYLKKQQSPRGDWEGIVLNFLADMEGGATALVTLALLNCGVKPEDPKLAKALDYLRGLPPKKTYVVGLQNMVFAEARQPRDVPLIQRNADWLISRALGWTVDDRGRVTGGRLEGWSYPGNAIGDNSNTQYALLGLYAAKQAGARIDDSVWHQIRQFYTNTQVKPTPTTGYWRYHNTKFDNQASFTMTVAGVCGLIIAGMGLDRSDQQLDVTTGVAANCGVYAENDPVNRGMNWIAGSFSFEQGKSIFYNVYGIERLGRLSGQRFVGKYDWYREGCQYLLGDKARGISPKQHPDGSITTGRGIDGADIISTAFALLFLSKGRTPVLMSKFAWGDFKDQGGGTFVEVGGPGNGAVNWNRKHNDARHVVEFSSRELFKGVPLAWQVYDVRRQNVDDDQRMLEEVGVLLQSPVLYLNGHGRIPFVGLEGSFLNMQEKMLQKYVDEGGFILAEACCGDKEFAASFRLLMKRLFPRNDFKELPENHAIWTAFYKDEGLAKFAGLEGLEKGCRTVVVFSPKPLAGYWEEHRFMPERDRPARRPNDPLYRGEMAFKLAANVIAYATGLELPKPRLTTTKLVKGPETNTPRGYFKPAQLKTLGESEPAPAAMRNLMAHLRENTGLEVVLDKEPLNPGDDELFKYKFMYLHGRKPLNFSDHDVETVRMNLQTGGLLFADAGCNGFDAWQKFDASFRDLCKRLFPDSPLQIIPPDDPLYSARTNGGSPVTTVRSRRLRADEKGPEAEMRNYPPLLEGIKVDGRWAVIYSKYDIGCALEGNKAADCMGHDRDSALKLSTAVVLYSLKR